MKNGRRDERTLAYIRGTNLYEFFAPSRGSRECRRGPRRVCTLFLLRKGASLFRFYSGIPILHADDVQMSHSESQSELS